MSIRDYSAILWRRKWVIIFTCVVVTAFAVVATLLATPMYEASILLRVLPVTGGGSDWVAYGTYDVERIMNTYAEFATSRPVLRELVSKLGVVEWPEVKAEILADTELMQITTEAIDPIVARDAANTLGDLLIAQSRALYVGSGKTAQEILGAQLAQVKAELDQAWSEYEALIAQSPEDADPISAASRTIQMKENTYAELLDQYERVRVREAVLANTLSVVEPAITPEGPSKPRKALNTALGLLVGLAGGVALAFLFENLDTTLYATEQIRNAAELPILGSVPAAGRQEPHSLFDSNSYAGEAFRRLRTSMFTLNHDSALRTVLVTSAEPREGKSTIASNLAFSVAQSGRKVIVVDAHLRLPTLHKVFDLSNRIGLSSVLQNKATLEEATQQGKIPGLYILTSGPLPAYPAELVSSPQMNELIAQMAQQFDMVILDTPSLLAVTDAAALARVVDGVMLVVERAQTRQESVKTARQQLDHFRAHAIGIVVNRAEPDGTYDYYRQMPT